LYLKRDKYIQALERESERERDVGAKSTKNANRPDDTHEI